MKPPPLPLLRYPTAPEQQTEREPLQLDPRLLQTGLAFGAGASGLFLLTQLLIGCLVTGLELHGQGLFLIPRFFQQVLGRGFWELPWFLFHAAVLGTQLWSLLQLRRLLRGWPQFALANRAVFSWQAMIGLFLLAGFSRLADSGVFALLATFLAALCGYAALICQAFIYRALARLRGNSGVATLALCLFSGLVIAPLLGVVSLGSAFISGVAVIIGSGGGKGPGQVNPQAFQEAEMLNLILVLVVLATMLLHFLMTVVFYLQSRTQRPPALPMAIEVLPDPLE